MVKIVLAVSAFLQFAGALLLLAGIAPLVKRLATHVEQEGRLSKTLQKGAEHAITGIFVSLMSVAIIVSLSVSLRLGDWTGLKTGNLFERWLSGALQFLVSLIIFFGSIGLLVYVTTRLDFLVNRFFPKVRLLVGSIVRPLKEPASVAIIGAYVSIPGVFGQFVGSAMDIFVK